MIEHDIEPDGFDWSEAEERLAQAFMDCIPSGIVEAIEDRTDDSMTLRLRDDDGVVRTWAFRFRIGEPLAADRVAEQSAPVVPRTGC